MTKSSSGFTLIEIVLVTAITGLMVAIVFAGQRQLRDRTSFDASINLALQRIAYARSYASTNVNEVGGGNDTSGVLAGAGIEFDNGHVAKGFPLTEVETVYANTDSDRNIDLSTLDDTWPVGAPVSTCPAADHPDDPTECVERFSNLSDSDIRVQGVSHAAFYYINTQTGPKVCHDVGNAWLAVHTACATFGGPPIDFVLGDSEGYTATIEVDQDTGLAKRLN